MLQTGNGNEVLSRKELLLKFGNFSEKWKEILSNDLVHCKVGLVPRWKHCKDTESFPVYAAVYKHNGKIEFAFYCPAYGCDRVELFTACNKNVTVWQYGGATIIIDESSSKSPVVKLISWY